MFSMQASLFSYLISADGKTNNSKKLTIEIGKHNFKHEFNEK